jgi:hypothetical protein
MKPGPFAGALLVLATTAGCKNTVGHEEIERFVERRTAELGLAGAKVGCPKGVEAKVGKQFDCNVELEGKTYVLTVTVTRVDGRKFDIDTAWKDGESVVSSKLGPALSDDLSRQFATKVEVSCGEPLRFLDRDRNVTCDLRAGATAARVIITFDERRVPIRWKLDPQLLAKAKLEQILTEPVRAKTAPTAQVTCGSEPLVSRPADGVIWCDLGGGDRPYRLRVSVDADANVTGWEVAGS